MVDKSTWPPEVRAYFESGARKVVTVTANEDYTLTITFDNGEVRTYDMADNLRGPAFAPLRDMACFNASLWMIMELLLGILTHLWIAISYGLTAWICARIVAIFTVYP